MEALKSRHIEGEGTSELHWQHWLAQAPMGTTLAEELLEGCERVVIVSPHPDDEILATAGIMQHCEASGLPCTVIAVTSGEASHPGSRLWTRDQLAQARERESAQALALLCPGSQIIHLRIPDGEVQDHQPQLESRLQQLLRPTDAVFCPWRYDGHPDHEATGEACAAATADIGSRLFEVPIWTWHWASPGDQRVPWQQAVRMPLSADQLDRKCLALSCFRSQLLPDPSTGRAAILPRWATARLLRNFEVILR